MIFVTLGTTKFPFNRLLETIDQVLIKLGKKERLIVQTGTNTYCFKYRNVEVFREITFDKMNFYFKKSRVVITHGGPATVYLYLLYSKSIPLIVPRLKKFGEHVDDHQLFFAQFLKKKNLGKIILKPQKLEEEIEDYLFHPQKQRFTDKKFLIKEKLVKKLIHFTEKLDDKC